MWAPHVGAGLDDIIPRVLLQIKGPALVLHAVEGESGRVMPCHRIEVDIRNNFLIIYAHKNIFSRSEFVRSSTKRNKVHSDSIIIIIP